MGSFTNTGTTVVSLTGIPYSSYEVITYMGNEGANGRNASINISSPAVSPTYSTTYYYSTDTNDGANPFVYVPVTNTVSTPIPLATTPSSPA